MDWGQIFTNLIAVSVAMGGAFAWLWARLDKKFEKIDESFKSVDLRFEQINGKIDGVHRRIDSELERTLQLESRVVKVEEFAGLAK